MCSKTCNTKVRLASTSYTCAVHHTNLHEHSGLRGKLIAHMFYALEQSESNAVTPLGLMNENLFLQHWIASLLMGGRLSVLNPMMYIRTVNSVDFKLM